MARKIGIKLKPSDEMEIVKLEEKMARLRKKKKKLYRAAYHRAKYKSKKGAVVIDEAKDYLAERQSNDIVKRLNEIKEIAIECRRMLKKDEEPE